MVTSGSTRASGDPGPRRYESGVPLGGIGAGKIEFCPDGRFTNITINNNWDAPIIDGRAKCPPIPRIKEGFLGSIPENDHRRKLLFSPEGVPGAWFAVHTPQTGAMVLKAIARPAFTAIPLDAMEYTGRFPVAIVNYRLSAAFDLLLEAYSSLELIEDNDAYYHSSMPLALFRFQIRNSSEAPLRVSVAFSWQNLFGIGGYAGSLINEPDPTPPEFREEDSAPGLWFTHAEDSRSDPRVLGDYSLRAWTDLPASLVSYCAGWDPLGEGNDVWDEFNRSGHLSDRNLAGTAGALAVGGTVPVDGDSSVVFALAWNMPHLLAGVTEWENLVTHSSPPPDPSWMDQPIQRVDYGHLYSRWFENSWETAGTGLRDWESIRSRLDHWQDRLLHSSLPESFASALCNDLYPLFSNTWYTGDGRFSVNEAPTDMKGCLGTIDQRAVANAAVAACFPWLDRSELELFADDQIQSEGDARRFGFHWNTTSGRFDLRLDREGAILHDVGWDHMEGGRTGRQPWLSAHWPDLTSVFTLQVYQHAIWTGDSQWLDRLYPKVQAALAFQARLDQNGDGLPDLWGSGCCTYDTEVYPYYGASPFVGTLYLAALRAAEKMALDRDERDDADQLRKRASKARRTMEQSLWDETLGYYLSWRDTSHRVWDNTPMAHGSQSSSCFIGQLAGAWWADLLMLGEVVDPSRRIKALERIGELNVAQVPGCPANEFNQKSGEYSESWPFYALVYYAAQAISVGLAESGWRAVEKIYRVRRELDGSLWDTPLEFSGDGNEQPQWGRWYMSSPASWYLLVALSGLRLDRIHGEMRLDPSWPGKWGDTMEALPVYLPGVQFRVECRNSRDLREIQMRVEQIHGTGFDLGRVTTLVPREFSQDEVDVEVQGLTNIRKIVEGGGRIIMEGHIPLRKEGDGFGIKISRRTGV